MTKKTGPNVTSGVVWALGKFFLSFHFLKTFLCFNLATTPTHHHSLPLSRSKRESEGLFTLFRRSIDVKNGPNDAKSVVWALGEFSFSYFIFFLDAN